MEPSPPPAAGAQRQKLTEMEIHPPLLDDPSSSTIWDWGDLFDFTVDDQFPVSFDAVDTLTSTLTTTLPELDEIETNQAQDRIRKRDPRLTCSNFLAGRVPCACPELDEKLEEGLPGKKRVRTTLSNQGVARCQVPLCEADISELKGYHKRRRVCLRCANASTVILDGENKRYCQQCGKFHLLSDFDEGKRSCRRKLERHNNRRRRKPDGSKVTVDKGPQGDLQSEDAAFDGEAVKDCQIVEKEALVDPEEGNVSALHSALNSLIVNSSDSGRKDDSKFSDSPSNCENKSFYSSTCPTGRISFKLYDWNPAEFPRRLRHQIFEWLASMPVELEGYIRPGCTILTLFLTMPTFMWTKLLEDPQLYLNDFVIVPGKMLSKRSPMLIYLNNMVFRVLKDGNSVMKVNIEGRSPKLHHVHPMCFEAGKPMEFFACGSYLLQPKFRLLVSFAGKYLSYDYCVSLPHGHTEECSRLGHQLCKIFIPHVEANLVGPAFIEVENESGLSNFIPVLIADGETCSEMKIIQQKFDASHASKGSDCESSAQRQMAFSEFFADVAWLLRKPSSESFHQTLSSLQIGRFNRLLDFLLQQESMAILEKILLNLKITLEKMEINKVANGRIDTDVRMFQKHMDSASNILHQKVKESDGLAFKQGCCTQERNSGRCSGTDMPSVSPCSCEDLETSLSGKIPFFIREVLVNVNHINERPNESCGLIFTNRVFKYRPALLLIATVVCLGVCAIILHPNHVSKLAVSIRRGLSDQL